MRDANADVTRRVIYECGSYGYLLVSAPSPCDKRTTILPARRLQPVVKTFKAENCKRNLNF